jgi:hypothetical protein
MVSVILNQLGHTKRHSNMSEQGLQNYAYKMYDCSNQWSMGINTRKTKLKFCSSIIQED